EVNRIRPRLAYCTRSFCTAGSGVGPSGTRRAAAMTGRLPRIPGGCGELHIGALLGEGHAGRTVGRINGAGRTQRSVATAMSSPLPSEALPVRVHNFAAGPAALPLEVLERAQSEFTDFNGLGMSVMEISHRSKDFVAVAAES